MFDDDMTLTIIGFVVFIVGLFLTLFICAENKLPDEIKDTNCIYYEEQIYCLQESEVK